ncbi:putative S-layer protein [Candidatus Woesearchaeota archaeon]|nr:putative S-layer protein [Candidatus Woesearchaeota archaeon]
MMKKLFSLLSVFIVGVLMSSMAFAAITVDFVKVNGDEVTESATNFILDVDRGDELDVKVRFKSDADLNDMQIEAVLRGVDSRETVDDITDTFDVKANVSYTKTLSLPLIDKIDQDKYKLRIRISDRDSPTVEKTYELDIGTQRHDVAVKDVVLSPSTEVKAGRALLATVRVNNRGEKDEDGVKVVVSIPDLGVSAADFIDELEAEDKDDDQATTEEMFLRIPDDAETGEYEVVVDVFFDDLDKKNTYITSIFVLGEEEVEEAPKAGDKTIITVATDKQSAAKGQEAAYPVALTNVGTSDKTYTIRADGAAWASFRVAPSNVLVIGAGESKAFTVYASAGKDAPVGEQTFTVTISSGDKVLKQLPLSINVQESATAAGSTLKRGLEVGLVVLVILLVIIGLIIGFSKLRGDEEEEGKEGKEYY